MNNSIQYRIAGVKDLSPVITLLETAKLPVTDIQSNKIDFIIATSENKVIGCIGVEKFSDQGLLRSFAVSSEYRNLNIGTNLYNRLLSFSKQSGILNLHLLTTTAEKYFLKKGFIIGKRDEAPALIKGTTEFGSLCPSSSSYMSRKVDDIALSYYSDVQKTQTDEESQSSFWSVNGRNLQFTSFNVLPNTVFEKHQHDSEQITFVLDGELFFEIDGVIHQLGKGDSIVIPSGKEHRVWTEASAVKAVDAWSPVNGKYSDQNH